MNGYSFEYPADPETGKSVDESLAGLLQSGDEAAENAAIWLSERVIDIEERCELLGRCLESSDPVHYWALGFKRHQLAYSFEPGHKRFRFLTVMNGASDKALLDRARKCFASC